MAPFNSALQTRQTPSGPPGVDPYVGVEDNRRLILGVAIFSIVLATLPVIGRFVSRRKSKLPWLTDDYLIVVAMVSSSFLF